MAETSTDPALLEIWQRFAHAECCWFSSVRPDGRAHIAPIWHVVHDQKIYVVTQPGSVRVRNITQNPSVSLALPDPLDVVIVEGWARFAPQARDTLRPLFQEKYNWDIGTDTSYTATVAVFPTKVMAWGGANGAVRRHLQAPGFDAQDATAPDATGPAIEGSTFRPGTEAGNP